MKGLSDLEGLFKAPALEEFLHVSAHNMAPEQYQQLLYIETLRRALIGFGSDKKNKTMEKMLKEKGIKEYSHTIFQFT